MTTVSDRKSLVALEGANIPARLRSEKRWAPWRGKWNPGRGKWDKIPVRADQPEIGLSTASPELWFSYEDALQAHQKSGGMTAGIGYVMTGCDNLVGIDLDNCIDDDGKIATWAQTIIDTVDSYTEISPSGRGARIFVEGRIDGDWTNHQVGVEVYAGHAARFLTVTGRRLAGMPDEVMDPAPGALAWLEETHCVKGVASKVEDKTPPVPLLLPEDQLPRLEDLNLPPRSREFLADGTCDTDRSRVVASTAVALFSAGLTQAEVLSMLVANPYTFGMALDHRRQDPDRATLYLWKHHVLKAEPLASKRMLTAADFDAFVDDLEVEQDDISTSAQPEGDGMFDDLGADPDAPTAAPEKKRKPRFEFMQAADYAAQARTVAWLIPGVLPRAELAGIYGESGAGKSFFVLDMLASLCASTPWWGKEIKRKHRVAYVAAEGAIGVQDRLKAIAIDRGLDLSGLDLYVLGDAPDIMDGDTVKMLVKQLARLGKLDLVVLDTLAQVTPGANENSSEDMGKAISHARGLARAVSAMALLVGHSGKDVTRGQRGWSGLKGAMDVQIVLTRTATYRAATVAKLKDGQGEGIEYMFNLKSVPVGFDEDGEQITSCVVEPIMNAMQIEDAKKQEAASKSKGRPKGTGKYFPSFQIAAQELCGVTNRRHDREAFVRAATQRILQDHPGAPAAHTRAGEAFDAAIATGQLLYTDADGNIVAEDDGWYKVKVPLQAPDDPGFDDLT